ncbi:hypothetical protein DUNSADRAFT_16317 [Dunaliella salina]|uniref:Uncharacterized protein n=1 Tax=Dunaliella salina TaxID=3046 RepID=A0ABQ7G3T5_DUNSA|nr:hypothetical protein DUNSADRAFT_16317 [Dunaliella salina]|eukprot:KAF5829267.1 hypothetical protein DUNSADRAFT_16317 [Dunaliella salina]
MAASSKSKCRMFADFFVFECCCWHVPTEAIDMTFISCVCLGVLLLQVANKSALHVPPLPCLLCVDVASCRWPTGALFMIYISHVFFVSVASCRWPTGVLFMYHPSHGIITDVEAEQYGVRALAMAHVGLPWAQVAQIRGLLRAKVEQEAWQPKHLAVPLRDWSLVDHVRQTLEERASLLPHSSLAIQSQCEALEREAKEERLAGEELARRARQDSGRLKEELVALKLAPKLGQGSSLASAVATPLIGGSRGDSSSRGDGGR